MDEIQVQEWSQKLKISPVEIVREELEMLILNELSQSAISKRLVFKGGTALRLCYGSPRFSQDIDFNQLTEIKTPELENVLSEVAKKEKALSVKEIINKRNTLFSLLLINNRALKQNFTIKIEISKKKYHLKKGNYALQTARSPLSFFSPILNVYSLEQILKEKQLAVKTRSEPRDYFDLWFIGGKLGKQVKIPKPKMNFSEFKGEISQLLPDNLKRWPKEFLKTYERH